MKYPKTFFEVGKHFLSASMAALALGVLPGIILYKETPYERYALGVILWVIFLLIGARLVARSEDSSRVNAQNH